VGDNTPGTNPQCKDDAVLAGLKASGQSDDITMLIVERDAYRTKLVVNDNGDGYTRPSPRVGPRHVGQALLRFYFIGSSRRSRQLGLVGGKLPAIVGRLVSIWFGLFGFADFRERMDDLMVVHHLGPPPTPK